jgi:hypothetical protein
LQREELHDVDSHAAHSPANRSEKGRASDPEKDISKDKPVKHEHHANAAEVGETANIKQNTTNKGFFRGRRLG